MTLKLGTAKIKITPPDRIFLAGFANRTEPFDGVQEDLFVRCFSLIQGHAELYIVQGDLLWWGCDFIADIRAAIKKRCGIKEKDILFAATHTHSGPQTGNLFLPSLGKRDEAYNAFLKTQVLCAIEKSKENIEDVIVKAYEGQSFIGINRRLKAKDGAVQMKPNPDGVIDHTVDVVVFESVDNQKIKAATVVYPCHANVSSDNLVSSDFCGVAMEMLEKEYSDSVFIYMQGFTANIRPNLSKDGNFVRGTSKEATEVAYKFYSDIKKALQTSSKLLEPCIGSHLISFPLAFRMSEEECIRNVSTHQNAGGVEGNWSSFLLSHKEAFLARQMELMRFDLSKDYAFLATNGEIVIDYAVFVKENARRKVVCCGYCNGMIGYVATAKQIEAGGYEAADFIYYFALPAGFSAEIEDTIKEQITSLLQE